jgi:prepilin-type processing-associated H-X9-DG protein
MSTRLVSYVTAAFFQVAYNANPPRGTNDPLYKSFVVNGYRPKIQNVGISSLKIYMSDGAAWSSGGVPDADFTWDGSDSSTPFSYFTDAGPWSFFTRSFQPGLPRMYAFRHGFRSSNTIGNDATAMRAYKLNCAFFDGHVETMSAYEAMNPLHWVPKSSVIDPTEFSSETTSFFPGMSNINQ